MQRIGVYESLVNADLTEGRGPMRHVGYFTNGVDAAESVRGMGVMGVGNGEVRQTEVIIFETFEEFADGNKEALRRSALAKLSSKEREALGL